jgi:C-5 cytosine-specific DNA methylase
MRILELFAGTRSISKAFESKGHQTYTVEWNQQHADIDWYKDIGNISAQDILERFGRPDVIWASPDCSTYSVAAISKHRRREADGNLAPISEKAIFCDNVNMNMIRLIEELQPKYFFIENPRGGLRKMDFIKHVPRFTVTYCQYGERRMKPTDIWTNHPQPNFKPPCKNGMPCHVSAPRGSVSGTQAIKGAVDRSRIPIALCEHIVKICTEDQ